MSRFSDDLVFGRFAESLLCNWLRHRCGYTVIPAYEIETPQHKGPRVFTPNQELVSPDALGIKGKDIRWFECKHKSVFTWFRKSKTWQTGIDKNHFEQYLKVDEHFGWQVWLLFLHESSTPNQLDVGHCPGPCPTGLYGGEISQLAACIHHESDRHGRHGMVYWNESSLRWIASAESVHKASVEFSQQMMAGVPNACGDEPAFAPGSRKKLINAG